MMGNFARLNPHPSDLSGVMEIPLFYDRFMVDNYSLKISSFFPLSFHGLESINRTIFPHILDYFRVGILLFTPHFLLFCQAVLPKRTLPFCLTLSFV